MAGSCSALILITGLAVTMGSGTSWLPTVAISCLCALVVAAPAASKALSLRGVRVELYDSGLVLIRGQRRSVVLFENVDAPWYELHVLSSMLGRYAIIRALRLIEHSGRELRVPLQIRDAVTVARWVFRHCSDHLLGDARSSLRSGGELDFASVRMTRESIVLRGKSVRWQDFRLIRLQSGRIAFFRRWPVFPWRTITLDRVPHPGLFCQLVKENARHFEVDLPPGLEPG